MAALPAEGCQPDPSSVGQTISYDISRCLHGGYVVWVDGSIYAACSTLGEAVAAMGRVAAEQYQDPDGPAAAAGDPIPSGIMPAPRAVPEAQSSSMIALAERARATMMLAFALLAGLGV